MATRKSSSKPKLVAVNKAPSLEDRAEIALSATLQMASIIIGISAIARELLGHDNDVSGQLLALAVRARDLNFVAMSALDDELHDCADLMQRLNGIDRPERATAA